MAGQALPKKDPARIDDLRRKIDDDEYLSGAIMRIAHVLSASLMETNGVPYEHRYELAGK